MIVWLFFIACISTDSLCFFWVPNRYTASYWSECPYITNRCISSCEVFIDGGSISNDQVTFNSIDGILSCYQSFGNGFFVETTIPITSATIQFHKDPSIHQTGGVCYQNSTVLGGWGINYDALPYVDFIDCMIRTGCILPAHTPLNPMFTSEFVYGYQTWGMPFSFNMAFGLCEWMLFGLHTSICYIHNNDTVWEIQPYFKADHLVHGISFWIGYSYTRSHENSCNVLFLTDNHGWQMHTVHYGIELEFIQSEFPIHPRLSLYYNQCISGSYILKQNRGGITMSLDIVW
jgi:hypothetical protein